MRTTLMDRYGRLIQFGAESRKAIKPETLEYIKSANALDWQLRSVAEELFDQWLHKLQDTGSLPQFPPREERWDRDQVLLDDDGFDLLVARPPEDSRQEL